MDDSKTVRFFRITVLGASACGKTSLVNSFVNRNAPSRYVRTEKAIVYMKKTELRDETDYNEMRRPVLVEIEDTPGSERGFDDDGDDGPAVATGGVPKIVKGSRVVVLKDKQEMMTLFSKFSQPSKGVVYKPGMDGMLGKEFNVRSVAKDGSMYLPSPDGTEGGVWTFPPGAAKLKVSLTLPIDDFLTMGEKEKVVCHSMKEKKQYSMALQRPLSAYNRPVGAPDVDKTLTKNRMGYCICFDVSDDSGSSLKEAMAVHQMLVKALEKKNSTLVPLIWLVGCKSDKTALYESVRQNIKSARVYADDQELLLHFTSAKEHKGVNEVFGEMIQAISSRTNLWTFHGDIDEEGEAEDQGACFSQ